MIKGYSGSKKELATGESRRTDPFMVGGHNWYIEYYPNGLYGEVEAKFSFRLRCMLVELVKR